MITEDDFCKCKEYIKLTRAKATRVAFHIYYKDDATLEECHALRHYFHEDYKGIQKRFWDFVQEAAKKEQHKRDTIRSYYK